MQKQRNDNDKLLKILKVQKEKLERLAPIEQEVHTQKQRLDEQQQTISNLTVRHCRSWSISARSTWLLRYTTPVFQAEKEKAMSIINILKEKKSKLESSLEVRC
jgi:K+/H+ antiporter YhaU regulatory subunit KhtT